MARPSLDQNPKFKLLVRRLAVPRPYVLGLLETMWRVAWENGEPVIGTTEEIEAAAEWPGEPGKFHAALVSGRLLDDVGDGRWAIHDFWDHAPEYVQKRRKRELERQQRGTELADNRRQRRPKSAARKKTAPKSRTPAPAPAPAPVVPPPTPSESSPPAGGTAANGGQTPPPEFPPEDPEANAYPWDAEDEHEHGDPVKPHPRWRDYVEVHMAQKTPAPWPRFLPWLKDDVQRRAQREKAGNPVHAPQPREAARKEALRRQMNGETPGDGCPAAPGLVEDLGPDVCVACHHKWGMHGDTGQRGCMAIGCSCGALMFPQAAVQRAEHQVVGPRAAEDQCASRDLAMVTGATP